MIGLSLSFCVRDILAGRVDISNVEKIISATAAATKKDAADLIENYMKTYWYDYDQDTVVKLLAKVLPIVEQPRLVNGRYPSVISGHWVEREDQIRWME